MNILEDLFPRPFWFPQALDRAQEWVRMVRFRRSDYVNAPFLDQRGLRKEMQSVTLPWDTVCDAVPADARRDSHWIFHISHTGSTLLSRLLDDLGGTLPLREPLIALSALDLPARARSERLEATVALLSRTFSKTERAIVKATSAVSDIAEDIMKLTSGKAIALSRRPDLFIAARLAGNLADLRGRGHSRRLRLERRLGIGLDPALVDDLAALAALSWACETSALEQLKRGVGGNRVLSIDFDQLVGDPVMHVGKVANHLGLRASSKTLARAAMGASMVKDAKNPAQPFDGDARMRRLERAAADHAADVARALTWLDELARKSDLVADALGRT